MAGGARHADPGDAPHLRRVGRGLCAFVPVLGLLDDLIILPVGIWLFTRMIPRPLWAEYRAMAEAETKRPVSYMGAALIAGIWLAAAALIALMVASWQYY